MVILRNKSFSRLKNAVNDYKYSLKTYRNDRKDPRALEKFKKQLKSEQKHIMEDNFHDFDDKNKTITFKGAKNPDGSMKKISFKSKEKYENEKSKLKEIGENIKKDWSDDKINKSIADYNEGLRHPRRKALKNAIQNLYSDIEKEEGKNPTTNNKFREVLNRINSTKPNHKRSRSSVLRNSALLNDQIANQQAWQSHINAVNNHSIATMGIPVM